MVDDAVHCSNTASLDESHSPPLSRTVSPLRTVHPRRRVAGRQCPGQGMAVSPRRTAVRLPREQRIQRILEAARSVFSERGYSDASMSDIAARVHIVEGTIYKYFESKRELLLQVLEAWYEGLFADCSRGLLGIAGTRDKLRHVAWRHLRTIRDQPLLSQLMFREVRARDDYHGTRLHTMNQRYTSLLVDVVQQGIDEGSIRADVSTRLVRDLLFGGLEHMTWRYVSGRGTLDIERHADELTAMLWQGVAAPKQTSADPQAPLPEDATHHALRAQIDRLERLVDRLTRAVPNQRMRS